MKKLQNNLYQHQGAYLHKETEKSLVVEINRQKAAQLPIHGIGGIFCFGNVLVSPQVMGFVVSMVFKAYFIHGIWSFSGPNTRQTIRQCSVTARSV